VGKKHIEKKKEKRLGDFGRKKEGTKPLKANGLGGVKPVKKNRGVKPTKEGATGHKSGPRTTKGGLGVGGVGTKEKSGLLHKPERKGGGGGGKGTGERKEKIFRGGNAAASGNTHTLRSSDPEKMQLKKRGGCFGQPTSNS